MFPRLGGAGAIAWRQLTTALRTARAMLIVLVIICISIGPALYFGGAHQKIENVFGRCDLLDHVHAGESATL